MVATFLLVAFCGCSSRTPSSSPSANNNTNPAPAAPKDKANLTSIGENYSAHYSPDGQRIVYVSRLRPFHSHSQIYEMDLKNRRERRVTFHDGENATPVYDGSGRKVYYASTTDEIKERPAFLQQVIDNTAPSPDKAGAPFEIYVSSLDGSDIRRLTTHAGFDSEISVYPKTGALLFSAWQDKVFQLFIIPQGSNDARPWIKSEFSDSEPAVSPRGHQVVWVRWSEDRKSSSLWIANFRGENPKAIVTGENININPAWTPDGEEIVFSSNRDQAKNFDIYSVKPDGTCLKRQTNEKADEFEPHVRPDGKELLFTSLKSGSKQLYIQTWPLNTTCP